MNAVQQHIQKLKSLLKDKFDANCDTGLYNLESDLLDHSLKDLDRFKYLATVCSLLTYARSNFYIKQVYRSSSHHLTSAFEKTLSAADIHTSNKTQERQKTWIIMRSTVSENLAHFSTAGPLLVREGSIVTSYCIKIIAKEERSGKGCRGG